MTLMSSLTHSCRVIARATRWLCALLAVMVLMASVDLHAQAKNRWVKSTSSVPTDVIRRGWAKGWRVTSVTGASSGRWTVVMSERSGYSSQKVGTGSTFPASFVRQSWNAKRAITEIAYANGVWLVVTSRAAGFRNRKYDSAASPGTLMRRFRNEGHHVTDLAYGNGQWVVVASTASSFGKQTWATSSSFPRDFISRGWKAGYDITELAYGGGTWAVVMTELLSSPRQSYERWTEGTNSAVRTAWQNGKQAIDIVYGPGYYVVVATQNLGEAMGLPVSSGGLLKATARRKSSRSATFTLDVFVVGSDAKLISLLSGDFRIKNFTIDGTRLEFKKTSVGTRTQGRAGPYSAQFLLDQSGSITGNDPNDTRIDAAKAFIQNLGGRDEVGLMAFADGGKLSYSPVTVYSTGGRRFTSNPNGFSSTLDELANLEGGGTPLYDAAAIAVDGVKKHANNTNRAVIVFTDGNDTASRNWNLDQVISYARRRGVPLHTIALSNNVSMAVLSKMAGKTGGSLAKAVDARRLVSYYGALGQYLSGSGRFYRTTWNMLLKGGSFRLGRNAWITSHIEVEIPGSNIYLPFRLDF